MTDNSTRDERAEQLRGELAIVEAHSAALGALVQSLLAPAVVVALSTPGAATPLTTDATADILDAAERSSRSLRAIDAQLPYLRFTGAA